MYQNRTHVEGVLSYSQKSSEQLVHFLEVLVEAHFKSKTKNLKLTQGNIKTLLELEHFQSIWRSGPAATSAPTPKR